MSSEEIKKRKLHYLECNLGDLHEGEQLNYICVDTKCKEMGILCPVCKTQKHSKHKVIPLKIFLSDTSVAYLQSKQNLHSVDALLNQVEQVHQKMLINLRETVQKMAQYELVLLYINLRSIKQLEEQVNTSFKYIKQKIVDQNTISQNFPQLFDLILNSQYENPEQLKSDIKKIIENVNINAQGKIEIEFKPQKVFDSYSKTSNEFSGGLTQLLNQFKQQVTKISKSMEKIAIPVQQVQQLGAGEYILSSTLKSATISVTENKFASQTSNQNQEQRFVLVEPNLDLTQKSKFVLLFQIILTKTGIQSNKHKQLGRCWDMLQEYHAGQKVQYKQNISLDLSLITTIQVMVHIQYHLMVILGLIQKKKIIYSINHLTLLMVTQQFVSLTRKKKYLGNYYYLNKILAFKKKGGEQKFQMNIQIPENEEVYACANLCNQNDKIELAMEEADGVDF